MLESVLGLDMLRYANSYLSALLDMKEMSIDSFLLESHYSFLNIRVCPLHQNWNPDSPKLTKCS